MPKYRASLSARSFRKLEKEIHDYRKSIVDKCEEFAYQMAKEGVDIAKMLVSSYGAIDTGELIGSIDLEAGDVITNGSQYIIFTDCEWAPFVEFGTGVMGEGAPHPDTSLVGWKYDVNEHGEAGWYYFHNGEWHWTKGMGSRPFMYDTGKLLRDRVATIAREVFGDD